MTDEWGASDYIDGQTELDIVGPPCDLCGRPRRLFSDLCDRCAVAIAELADRIGEPRDLR